MTIKEKLFFTKNLSILLKSSVPLMESLTIIIDQITNPNLKKIMSNINLDVANGQNLSSCFEKYPREFDAFFVNIIKVGEESGTLEQSLDFLAKQLSKDYQLKQKISGALLYPGLIFGATTIIGGFIAFFILPQLVDFFSAFDMELPITTKILLWFANMMKDHSLLIAILIGAITILCTILIQIKDVKKFVQQLSFGLPIFGQLIHFGLLARFSRNLGILLNSGVPIVTSLDIVANTVDNIPFHQAITEAKSAIKKGKQLSSGLEINQNVFSKTLVKMTETGEKSGKLEETLSYIGDFYEEEIGNIAKNLTTILEPVLLLIIGIVVGFVALAIIGPIYQLTGNIG